MARLQLDLSDTTSKLIDQLAVLCDLKTKKDVVENALMLLGWAASEVQNGGTIAAVNEERQTYKGILLPALMGAKTSAANNQRFTKKYEPAKEEFKEEFKEDFKEEFHLILEELEQKVRRAPKGLYGVEDYQRLLEELEQKLVQEGPQSLPAVEDLQRLLKATEQQARLDAVEQQARLHKDYQRLLKAIEQQARLHDEKGQLKQGLRAAPAA